MTKNIYTNTETDKKIEELQKNPNFNLAQFFRVAVDEYFNKNQGITNDKELILKKVEAELEAKKAEFNLLNEELIKAKTQKTKELVEKENSKKESINNYISYFLKSSSRKPISDLNIPQSMLKDLAFEWATHIEEVGVMKGISPITFLKEKGYSPLEVVNE